MPRRERFVSFVFPPRSGERDRQANCVSLSPRSCFDDTGCVTDGELIALIRRSNSSKMRAADIRAEFAQCTPQRACQRVAYLGTLLRQYGTWQSDAVGDG